MYLAELLCAPRLSVLEEEPAVPLSSTFTLSCHLPGRARKTDWIRSGSILNNNHRVNIVRDGTWNNLTITNINRYKVGAKIIPPLKSKIHPKIGKKKTKTVEIL